MSERLEEAKRLVKQKSLAEAVILVHTIEQTELLEEIAEKLPSKRQGHSFLFSEKLEITSPNAGTFSLKTVVVPITGELKRVTVRPTAADEDDYFQLLYGNRVLIDKIYAYGATASSLTLLPEKEEGEPIRKGERLTLKYWNAGTTSKDVDITFHTLVP